MNSLALFTAVFASSATLIFSSSRVRNIISATGKTDGRLNFSPTRLTGTDNATLVLLIIFKYIASIFHQGPRLRPASDGKSFALPPLRLETPLEVDQTDINYFKDAVDSTTDTKTVSPILLAGVTTPLMLILLSNRNCPVLPFGAVNTQNRFEFLDAVACRDVTSLREAFIEARLGGDELPGRRVKRGMEFEIIVDVKAKFDGSDSPRIVFRQIIGILVFLPKSTKPAWTEDPKSQTVATKLFETPDEKIVFNSGAPKKWVLVCHDVNPIHMSSVAAKLLGFPGKIAHGNHVVACVVEKQRDGRAKNGMGKLIWQSDKPSFLEVAFKRPMVLPITLQTRFELANAGEAQESGSFEVVRGDKTHIEASWGVL